MQHAPWIGDRFAGGIDGQRLLLFGFFHYGAYEDGHDDSEFTRYVMQRWALGGEIPFFTTLASYFDYTDLPDFYARVAFANTLPYSVGDEEEKFSLGDPAACAMVEDRVRGLIREIDPDKVIVFTKKGWRLFPSFDDRTEDGLIEIADSKPIQFGGYTRTSEGSALAFGLRHPMMAPTELMKRSIRAIMAAG